MTKPAAMDVHAQEEALRRPEVAEALRDELVAAGVRRAIVVGIPAAMEEPFLKAPLIRAGIMVLTPPAPQRAWLAQAINALAQGPATPQAIAAFQALVEDGAEHGVDCLVVASLELMGLAQACSFELPLVDALRAGSSRVHNVLFDMGGVLLRWDPLHLARTACKTEEDARLLSSAIFESAEWALQDAGAVDAETVAWTSKQRVPERLHDAVDQLVHHWHDKREFFPQTGELIRELKGRGYGIYLLSNAGPAFNEYKGQLPAYECFDGMVVSCFEHVVKPDARIYRIACERYGLDPAACLFIDDVPTNVRGARRVGIQGWHFDGTVEGLRHFLLGSA